MAVDQAKLALYFERRDNMDFEGKRGCINCSHCRIYGEPSYPMAYCEKYHGLPMPLADMYKKADRTTGFREAWTCPDRDFMDDSLEPRMGRRKEGAT